MLSSAQKQHKPPASRADCVNCGAPSHSQVTGLFRHPPNVRSLHMTRQDHGTVGCLIYVYAGSFRSSCLYVTTSYYFPVNHFPLFFFLQVILKELFEAGTLGLGPGKWQPRTGSCIVQKLKILAHISNFPVEVFSSLCQFL